MTFEPLQILAVGFMLGLLTMQSARIIDLLREVRDEIRDVKNNMVLEADLDDDDSESWKRG
jgi:hypothetical protein